MQAKATRLQLFAFSTIPQRVFHLTWMAFFVCFFAWFAVAPLMPLIRSDLGLSKDQIANINIAAVCVTILVRLIIGPLCDMYGPRRTYTWLLALGSVPVFGIAFSHSYESFLFFRLCIGAIGASFVITQYHTSVMYAPNVVGTASSTAIGWGNAGGGATQALMPLIVTALLSAGLQQVAGWRVAIFVPGLLMLVMAVLYYRYADDTPSGRITSKTLAAGSSKPRGMATFMAAARDYRVWMLFVTYGACFGVELTIHNMASIYYVDHFGLDLKTAGMYVGAFGLLALFARSCGGILSDRIARVRGLDGRTAVLFALILAEGVGLMTFAKMDTAAMAFVAMLTFGLFTHMACGATDALVPLINRKALGGVAGTIGAGGSVGAVAAGFLMKGADSTERGLFTLGALVAVSAICALAVRFTAAHKSAEQKLYDAAVAARAGMTGVAITTG
jgi:NNP family nitrate/nitrite transporter-like MFS transporter